MISEHRSTLWYVHARPIRFPASTLDLGMPMPWPCKLDPLCYWFLAAHGVVCPTCCTICLLAGHCRLSSSCPLLY